MLKLQLGDFDMSDKMPRKPKGITEKRAIKENIEEAKRMLPLQRRAFRLNKKQCRKGGKHEPYDFRGI